ncbi:MAG: DMT family transporter [Rhodoferax sp.]
MQDIRQPLDRRAAGLMVLLCAIWGLQQVVLKAVAADISPMMHIAVRSAVSALLVSALMVWRREPWPGRDGTARAGCVVAGLFALEFVLVGQGLRYTSASHTVVFLYTAPIFAALGLAWRLPAERLGRWQWLGIGLAFGGLALSFGLRGAGQPQGDALRVLWGDLLGLLAGLSWAATTVVVRSSALARSSATQTLWYQLVGAAVVLLALSWATGQAGIRFTPGVWASLVFQSVVVSFASFLVWFWLLRHYLASRLGVFSFLTPLFGVAFGALLLGEPLEAGFVLGAVPVLAGVVLVSVNPGATRPKA